MYVSEVQINEKSIKRLIKTYKKAQKDILQEVMSATDFGVARRRRILAQIDDILRTLKVTTDTFIQEELPIQYYGGADDAIKQLKNIKAPIMVDEGFSRIHQDAVAAMVDETAEAFAEAMVGISRSGKRLLGRVSRELITQRLAKGMIGGEARKQVTREIKAIILDSGINALVDRGGRRWSLERYADMLFRTKSVEARNRGLVNRLLENNYDLVQVSKHTGACELCAPWEGKILSASGSTKGYKTVAQAEEGGLFHPNCRHAINVLVPKLARLTSAYDPETKTILPPSNMRGDLI